MPPQWLDVDIDFHLPVAQFANFFFQVSGLAVRVAQAQFFVHFQVHLNEQAPILLHSGQVMNGEAQALRGGANRFKKMFALGRARLRVHHHVRRDDFADAFFDGVAQSMHLLEARGPRHAHRCIHKVAIARAPNAHAIDIQHAVHARYGLGDFLLQSLRRRVQQRVQRASAELRAHPQNDGCDRQARQSVSVVQPGQVPRFTGPHQPDTGDHDDGAPYVGRKMQRIRLQRFAGIFSSDVLEGPCSR